MAKLVINFPVNPKAQGYKVEYSEDGGITFEVSENSPATASPVTVVEPVLEGESYIVKLTALGDGNNTLDSAPVTSDPVTVDLPAEQLETPTIDSVVVE